MLRKIQNSGEDLLPQQTALNSFETLGKLIENYRNELAKIAFQLNSLWHANQQLKKEIDKISQLLMAQTVVVQFPFYYAPQEATLAAYRHFIAQYNVNAEVYNKLIIERNKTVEYMKALESARAAWVEEKQEIQKPPASLPPIAGNELLLWNTRHYKNPKYQNLQSPHCQSLEEMADEICNDTARGIRYPKNSPRSTHASIKLK